MSAYTQAKAAAAGLSAGHSLSGAWMLMLSWLAPDDVRSWVFWSSVPVLLMAVFWFSVHAAFAWAERKVGGR